MDANSKPRIVKLAGGDTYFPGRNAPQPNVPQPQPQDAGASAQDAIDAEAAKARAGERDYACPWCAMTAKDERVFREHIVGLHSDALADSAEQTRRAEQAMAGRAIRRVKA